ncbi:MAG: c-type cytochrome [Woeseiaceae bacterium]
MKVFFNRVMITASIALLAGCAERAGPADTTQPRAPLLTAETLGEQTVLTVTEYLEQSSYASADQVNGARQARVCRACHSLDAGGANMIGPALHQFFGTVAGSREGFQYSEVLRNAQFVWTPRALDAWLVQPGRFLPGNRMVFAGVSNARDRNDLIAYLLKETSATSADKDG